MKNLFLKSLLVLAFFTLACCSSDDQPCKPVVCQNEGISNGACGCNCPTGYAGADCSLLLAPLSMQITKITITQFPPTLNGEDWDNNAIGNFRKPDIYIKLLGPDGPMIDTSIDVYQDAQYDGVYSYTLATPLTIESVNKLYLIQLFNENVGDDQLMTATSFYFYTPNQPFVDVLPYEDPNGFHFQFDVTYQW